MSYLKRKKSSLENSILSVWSEAAKKEGNAFGMALQAAKENGDKKFTVNGKTYDVKTEMDKVNKVALGKKFKDRKDKDIDNDGDTDSSDEFLHKKRKAISKAMAKETKKENFEVGTKERRDHTIEETPGQSVEDFEKQVDAMQSKNNYMREQLAKMWGMEEGKNPFVKDPKKEEKKPKTEKTMTGKKATEVKVDPELEEKKDK